MTLPNKQTEYDWMNTKNLTQMLHTQRQSQLVIGLINELIACHLTHEYYYFVIYFEIINECGQIHGH